MQPRGRGKIVNICSVQSETVRLGIAPYSATKGGLKPLSKGTCADLGPSGIQVNGLAPGYFENRADRRAGRRRTVQRLGSCADACRALGPRGGPGRALIFLLSDASAFVNGQLLYVDGGMLSVL